MFVIRIIQAGMLYCIILGPQAVGVQCPITYSLGEFPGYWDWLRYLLFISVFSLFGFSLVSVLPCLEIDYVSSSVTF